MKRKLVLVTDSWVQQVNGVTTALTTLAPLLQERGLDVVVVHAGLFKRCIRFPFNHEILLPLFPGRRMRQLITHEQPDFVHIATEGTLGISARNICKKKKVPFTTCYHSNYPLYAEYYLPFGKHLSPFVWKLMRWFHNASEATMVTTESMKILLESKGFASVRIWPLGIDTERFVRNTSFVSPLPLVHPIFVYMGRVATEKNIGEFLEASLPGTKLVIGDGPNRHELESKFASDTTVFVGYKRGQELVDWLSLGDVYVFPSRTETFGLSVVEALSCGIPVAAHDVTGPHDIITPGVDGMLDENIGTAALACVSLSAEACRAKALEYSWQRSADIFLEHITEFPVQKSVYTK